MKITGNVSKKWTLEGLFLLITLLCVFLGTLNLVNRYYFFIYIGAIVLFAYPGRRFRLDKSFLVLMLFSINMLLFNPGNQSRVLDMIKPFTYPLCYLMGASMFISDTDENIDLNEEAKKTSLIIYVVAAGSFVHFLLNMSINQNADDRHVIDFWTNDEMSATGQAVLACFVIAVAVSFLFSKVSKVKKIIAAVSLVFVASYNLILAGRTLFVLLLILLAFALLYDAFTIKRINLKIVFIILAVILLLAILYNADLFGIKTAFESSNFYDRFLDGSNNQVFDDDKRMEHKIVYLKYFFDYPFGGGKIHSLYGHHAHDLYLDTYDSSGIFALFSILAYIVFSLCRMFKCHKSRELSYENKLLILSAYLVTNIQFWLEPIIVGEPWFLAAYCLFDGAVAQLLSKEKKMFW